MIREHKNEPLTSEIYDCFVLTGLSVIVCNFTYPFYSSYYSFSKVCYHLSVSFSPSAPIRLVSPQFQALHFTFFFVCKRGRCLSSFVSILSMQRLSLSAHFITLRGPKMARCSETLAAYLKECCYAS